MKLVKCQCSLLDQGNIQISVWLFESSLIPPASPPIEIFFLFSSFTTPSTYFYFCTLGFYFYTSLIFSLNYEISESSMVWLMNVRIRKSWFCIQVPSHLYSVWPNLSNIHFPHWNMALITTSYFLYTSKWCYANQMRTICKVQVL